MKIGSLFSGIGGFDEGFHRAGFDVAWQVEKDETCRIVLKRHYPKTEIHTDVKEVGKANLSAVDVIVGGFPCQDLSVAGKREGLAGERSGLWFEFHRVLEEIRPRWCVIENVPGLLSSNGGRDFAVILRGLVELGYGVAYRILDAQYFGVAQRRRRVLIVGSLGDGSCAEILFEPESGAGDSPPSREAGARTAARVDGSPYADREAEHSRLVAGTLKQRGRGATDEVMDNLQIAATLNPGAHPGGHNGQDDTKDGHLLVIPILEAGARTNGDGYRDGDGIGNPGDPMFTLQRGKQRAVAAPLTAGMSATKGVNPPGRRKEDDVNLVCATLNSGGNSGGFRTEPGNHLVASPITVAYAKSASDDNDGLNGHLVTHALRSEGADASEDGTGRGTPIVAVETLSLQGYNMEHGKTQETDTGKVLRVLRQEIGEEAFAEWGLGILDSFQPTKVLQSDLHGEGIRGTEEGGSRMGNCAPSRPPNLPKGTLRKMWKAGSARRSPQGSKLSQQFSRELRAYLSELPQQRTQATRFLRDLWSAGEGIGVLREALSAIQEDGRPSQDEDAGSSEVSGLYRTGERKGTVREALYAGQESGNITTRGRGVSSYGVRRLTPL